MAMELEPTSTNPDTYMCQDCEEQIGWLGRFLFPFLHKCKKEDKE